MFITSKERNGTCYLEFQFCKNDKPIKFGKVNVDLIVSWKEDSLLISDDDFNDFYKLYGKIFDCALFPNGENGFCSYGINYYDKNNSKKILFELKKCIDKKHLNLLEWLEIAVKNYNGFYILGI